MYEFGIYNNNTKERTIIFGRNAEQAFQRAKLEDMEWTIEYVEYID